MRLASFGELVRHELPRGQRRVPLQPLENGVLEALVRRRQRLGEDDDDLGAPTDERVIGERHGQDPLGLPAADEGVEASSQRADLTVRRRPALWKDEERLPGPHETHELPEVRGRPRGAGAPERLGPFAP